jgi:aspartate 1-decarboxylase
MLRQLLKSKIHRAVVTDANVEYEGSISIDEALMDAADLWEGEKVLVASVTTGARLETYVQKSPRGSGDIVINGGAAHLIRAGERVTIMAYATTDQPLTPKRVVLDAQNRIAG